MRGEMSAQQAEHGMNPTFDCIYYLNLTGFILSLEN